MSWPDAWHPAGAEHDRRRAQGGVRARGEPAAAAAAGAIFFPLAFPHAAAPLLQPLLQPQQVTLLLQNHSLSVSCASEKLCCDRFQHFMGQKPQLSMRFLLWRSPYSRSRSRSRSRYSRSYSRSRSRTPPRQAPPVAARGRGRSPTYSRSYSQSRSRSYSRSCSRSMSRSPTPPLRRGRSTGLRGPPRNDRSAPALGLLLRGCATRSSLSLRGSVCVAAGAFSV